MKLEPGVLDKADPLLRKALEQAQGDEVLRAVVSLRPVEPERVEAPVVRPGMSRAEYRSAIIAQRRQSLGSQIGQTVAALERFNLKPRGGDLTAVVVVEGAAADIGRSLALDGVRHASLDRKISLVAPVLSPNRSAGRRR